MGSTLESQRMVRAAVKPSDEPLRKGETVRPLIFVSGFLWLGLDTTVFGR